MQIEGLTRGNIETAAKKAGVRLATPWLGCHRVVIRTLGPGKGIPWTKIGRTGRTIPGRVCWHGHRQFMRECFRINPDAVVRSCLATYNGSEHFERTHKETEPYYVTESTGWDCHSGHGYREDCRCGDSVAMDESGGYGIPEDCPLT